MDQSTRSQAGDDTGDVLNELRERMQLCITAERENRDNALDDLRFVKGDHWPESVKRMRDIEKRPCLTFNTLPTFLRQVTNDLRQNRPAINVHPVDDDADVETAEVLQGLIRHIEYSSNADVATDTAVTSAAAIGFGYFRLVTEYGADDSFDQDIVFKRIRNPFTVYFDPMSQEPDGSDSRFCILVEEVPKEDFKRLYPKAEAASLSDRGVGDTLRYWINEEVIRVAEYYRIEEEDAELVRLTNGETGWQSDLLELPPGVTIAQTRTSKRRRVMWRKCTGVDVLEEAEIPCRWIPVFPVYGDEIDIEGRVYRAGVVRNAKDPSRMYDFWMTSATEEVSLRPKSPYIMAEGQEEGHEAEWAAANVRSFPYLTYKPTTVAGQLAPAPHRQPMADVPVGVLQMALHARDDIKAVTGIFDASLGASGNEKSGVAITARQRQGDRANFHFADNLGRTLRHVGRVMLDMIPRIYDTERVVRILGEDEQPRHVAINQPLPQPEVDDDTGAIKRVLNDLTIGKYDVTISTGPSYSTLRQEAADAMIAFGQSWPKLMDIAGDKVVKSMDWPGADDIAERIARTIPPQIKGEEDGEQADAVMTPQGPVPKEQAGQIIAQMAQALEQMQAQLQDASSGLEKERLKAESAERIARINADARLDAEEVKGWIAMLLQQMTPPPALTAAVAQDMDFAPQGGSPGDDALATQYSQQPQTATGAAESGPQIVG